MAREYFKNLPNTTTPLRAERINGLLNGEESIEKIVAGSIEGKNLFDKNNANIINNAGFTLGSPTITANTGDAIIYISCNENTTYTVSKRASSSSRSIGYTSSIPAVGSTVSGVVNIPANGTNATITTGTEAKYLAIRIYNEGQDSSVTLQQMLATVQIEKGSSATEYDEYMKYGYNSEKSMGNIVVDDISCKNSFDNLFRQGSWFDTINATRIYSSQKLYLKAGTYTVSTNLNFTTFDYAIDLATFTSPAGAGHSPDIYDSGWLSTLSHTFTISQSGYFYIGVRKKDNSNITPSDISNTYFQLEQGSEATSFTPHKEFDSTPITKIWSGSVYNQNDTMTLSKKLEVNKLYMIRYFDNSSYFYGSHMFLYLGGTTQNENLAQINFYNYDDGTRTRYRLEYNGNLTVSIKLANNGSSARAITDIYEIK